MTSPFKVCNFFTQSLKPARVNIVTLTAIDRRDCRLLNDLGRIAIGLSDTKIINFNPLTR